MKIIRYAFIGAGNMGGAIIRALCGKGGVPAENVTLYDADSEKYKNFPGCKAAESAADAVRAAEYIFLAVKPQNFPQVLGELSDAFGTDGFDGKIFISIAAGISVGFIKERLGSKTAVIRTMPNAPLMVGKGVTALCRSAEVAEKSFREVCRTFSLVGEITVIDESRMNAIIAATSSSPAFVCRLIEAMEAEARAEGLDGEDLTKLICRAVSGTAEMIVSTGMTPAELRRAVTSPKGTTEAALRVFDERGLDETVAEAMRACTARAEELGK